MPTASSPSKRRRGACALCGKPASEAHTPFCSQGCRDRDLLNWLGEGYRVAGAPADENSPDFTPDGVDGER